MNFWLALGVATTFLIIAIIVFATKFLFPYHRILAVVVYGLGWIPFLYSISLKKDWLLQHQGTVTSFFTAYWIHLIFGIVMLVVLYVFLVLFPVARSPFIGLAEDEISSRLSEDKTLLLYLDERLEGLLTEAEEEKLFEIDFRNITGEEKEDLHEFWTSYLEVLLELDLLKNRYTTFYQLNSISQPELHTQAFLNGYTAFLAQHHYTLQLQENARGKSDLLAYLNQLIESQGVARGTFNDIVNKLTDPDELIRLNTGRAYYLAVSTSGEQKDLVDSYLETIDSSIGSYSKLIAKKPLNFMERNSFKLWFPIQKQAAINISYIRTASREYHISSDEINKYRDRFLPGDILLERREWHATNVGIPGFWTHSALYLGTLEELDTYFADVPVLGGKSFSEYIKENFPEAHQKLSEVDENGYPHAVIEAKRPGVIMMSLEGTANADALGVLRVKNLDKDKQFKIITQSLGYLGKPYDYDFNFVTDDALVCSELVYKAYQDIPELSIEPKEFNGRPIVSPNDFAIKFSEEMNTDTAELELILFLDGNEKNRSVAEKSKAEFATSWSRPKWHIVTDFVEQ